MHFFCTLYKVFLKAMQLFSQTFYCILFKYFEINRHVYETARANIVKKLQ